MFVSRLATLHDVRKCILTIFCSLLLFWGILHDLYCFPLNFQSKIFFFVCYFRKCLSPLKQMLNHQCRVRERVRSINTQVQGSTHHFSRACFFKKDKTRKKKVFIVGPPFLLRMSTTHHFHSGTLLVIHYKKKKFNFT